MRFRAENGTRTRDPNLGKVVLYQLSYFRNKQIKSCEEEETRTPTTQLSLPPQSSASTNSATPPTCKNILNISAQNRTRTCTSWNTRTWNVRVYQFRHLGIFAQSNALRIDIQNVWAENGTRTRDPNLGKVVLYQLSYFRNISCLQESSLLIAVAKVVFFSEPTNFFGTFFNIFFKKCCKSAEKVAFCA